MCKKSNARFTSLKNDEIMSVNLIQITLIMPDIILS